MDSWVTDFTRQSCGCCRKLHFELWSTPQVCTIEFTSEVVGFHALGSGNLSLSTDAWYIPDVCLEPAAIWRGLKRQGQDSTLVYSGIPSGQFAEDHGQEDLSVPDGMTLVLFITPDCIVRKYRWEESEQHAGYPTNHSARFEELLWSPT